MSNNKQPEVNKNITNREVHEEAAGMNLDNYFFKFNGIDPDAQCEKQPEVKCLICGHPVQIVEHVIFDKKTKAQAATETYFYCKNETCKTVFIIPLPGAEAFARFQQRQESPEKRKLERLKQFVEYELYKLKDYEGDPVSLHTKELLERETYVYKKIEKELNG